jgi:hypothetical protein
MILKLTDLDHEHPEAWMFEPLAVQEFHAHLGGQTLIRVEDPNYTPILLTVRKADAIDDTLPSSWVGAQMAKGHFVFGPSAFQRPGFWDEYFAADLDAVDTYNAYRTDRPGVPDIVATIRQSRHERTQAILDATGELEPRTGQED